MSGMQRRNWVPDVKTIADQLVADYRSNPADEYQSNVDALNTIASWIATAEEHDDVFAESDWIALTQELASRVARLSSESADDD